MRLIVVVFIDKNSPIGRLYQKKKKERLFYRYAHFYSVKKVTNKLKKAGFTGFSYRQTLNNLNNETVQTFEEGYGKGGFVVIKGNKIKKYYHSLETPLDMGPVHKTEKIL